MIFFNIAIIGKPNTGKTTLFNRLVGKKTGIVYDTPGVTRDARSSKILVKEKYFTLHDTPGIEHRLAKDPLHKLMTDAAMNVVHESQLCIFTLNSNDPVDECDIEIIKKLRKLNKVVVTVFTKADKLKDGIPHIDLYKYSIGESILVSSEFITGIHELKKRINEEYLKYLETFESLTSGMDTDKEEKAKLTISIVGRPNTGKSTLTNKILKKDVMVVSDIAGTTIDSVGFYFDLDGQRIKFIDTAGIRRVNKVTSAIENMSITDSINSINFSDVCILLIDAQDPFNQQDIFILSKILKEGRLPILIINKIDLIKKRDVDKLIEEIKTFIQNKIYDVYMPAFFVISAMKENNMTHLLRESIKFFDKYQGRVKTSKMNNFLQKFNASNNMPKIGHTKTLKIKYITQIKSKPPTFVIHSNANEEDVNKNFISMFKKRIIENFEMYGVPIRFKFIKKKNPYVH